MMTGTEKRNNYIIVCMLNETTKEQSLNLSHIENAPWARLSGTLGPMQVGKRYEFGLGAWSSNFIFSGDVIL